MKSRTHRNRGHKQNSLEMVQLTHVLKGHAKSLQSCSTLCYPIDSSPPGSPIPGILQARTLEWVAISFSNAWKWKVKGKSLSCVRLFMTPWAAAYHIFFSKNSKINVVITLIKYILIITGQLMSQFINCILIFPPLGSGFNSLRISFYLPQKWDMILIYQEQRGSLSQVKFEAICLERQNRGFRLGTLDKCIRH